MLSRWIHSLHHILHRPSQVFFLAAVMTFLFLIFDGSLWKFWNLQRSQEQMQVRMEDLEEQAKKLEFKIHQAKNLTYIERQATDQFDYVREVDLIFVFSE